MLLLSLVNIARLPKLASTSMVPRTAIMQSKDHLVSGPLLFFELNVFNSFSTPSGEMSICLYFLVFTVVFSNEPLAKSLGLSEVQLSKYLIAFDVDLLEEITLHQMYTSFDVAVIIGMSFYKVLTLLNQSALISGMLAVG